MNLRGGCRTICRIEQPPQAYPPDVSDDEWAFIAPYLTLMRANASKRRHDLRVLPRCLHTGAAGPIIPSMRRSAGVRD